MTHKIFSTRIGSIIRRGLDRARHRKLQRLARRDLSRLSDHILNDIGCRRQGARAG